MSGDHRRRGGASDDYEVGYGKPPKATRFGHRPQPDRSKRKAPQKQEPDIAALLDRPIEAKIGGKLVKMHPHEAMLHGLFKRVCAGEIRAIKQFLEVCKRAGVPDCPKSEAPSPVVCVPEGVPGELAGLMIRIAGLPRWDEDLYAQKLAEYNSDCAHIEKLKAEAKAKLHEQTP